MDKKARPYGSIKQYIRIFIHTNRRFCIIMNDHEDVRITKSKRDLCNALMELMQTTPFKKITVGDICSTAMINRMTFYKHYADKYELLNEILLGIKRSILEKAKPDESAPDPTLDFTFKLIDAVVEECLIRKNMLMMVNNDDMVLTMISNTIEKSVSDLLLEMSRKYQFRFQIDALAVAITGSTTFLIRYWLYHEPEESKDLFMAKCKEFLSELFQSKILFT